MKTKEILEKAKKVVLLERVAAWYGKHMAGEKQSDTVETLVWGVDRGDISIREALYISFIVGFQWHEDFEKAGKEG